MPRRRARQQPDDRRDQAVARDRAQGQAVRPLDGEHGAGPAGRGQREHRGRVQLGQEHGVDAQVGAGRACRATAPAPGRAGRPGRAARRRRAPRGPAGAARRARPWWRRASGPPAGTAARPRRGPPTGSRARAGRGGVPVPVLVVMLVVTADDRRRGQLVVAERAVRVALDAGTTDARARRPPPRPGGGRPHRPCRPHRGRPRPVRACPWHRGHAIRRHRAALLARTAAAEPEPPAAPAAVPSRRRAPKLPNAPPNPPAPAAGGRSGRRRAVRSGWAGAVPPGVNRRCGAGAARQGEVAPSDRRALTEAAPRCRSRVPAGRRAGRGALLGAADRRRGRAPGRR